MKKLGFILLIVAASFFGYLVWSYFASTASDTLVVPAGQTDNKKPSVLGANIENLQDNFLDSVKKKIEEAKTFVGQIPEAANNIFNDLVDKTKDTAKEKLIDILEATSSPATAPEQGSPATDTGIGTAKNSATEPNVCFIVSKGESVDYGIDQPFAGEQETSYKIDWGDGKTMNGLFHSGDKNIIFSHSYAGSGAYSIAFKITNGSTALTASRSVCVK